MNKIENNVVKFLQSAIDEMDGYIKDKNNGYDDLERHDCSVAREAYEHVLNYVTQMQMINERKVELIDQQKFGRCEFKVKVLNQNGNDVSNQQDWYVDTNGVLYFLTNDIDNPLQEAGDNYKYQIDGNHKHKIVIGI